jgi:beta-glucanase (GH16 family)
MPRSSAQRRFLFGAPPRIARRAFRIASASVVLLGALGACKHEATGTASAVVPTPPSWKLVWHDEFNGPALDTTIWTFDTGGGGWGNAELEYYTNRSTNARVDSGNLIIEARQEPMGGRAYTSARIKTSPLRGGAWQYGRIEARIQIPRGQGMWPAFWMLGDNIGTVGWPTCGEIDIMENIGSEPGRVHGTVHGPGYSGAQGVTHFYDLPGGAFADAYHVFAVEWAPTLIRWFVDSVQYHSVTPIGVPGPWVYDHPFFIILNVAVGGSWPGSPDATTVFPQLMHVDYVRVYQHTAQ